MATRDAVMDTDDTDDWEEEQVNYVLLELSGITAQEFKNNSGQVHLLGVNSPNPYLKLDNYVFKGEYKSTAGTAVFFEESNEKIDNVPTMDYLCKTSRKLEMERVFLKQKQHTSDAHAKKLSTDRSEEATHADNKMDTT